MFCIHIVGELVSVLEHGKLNEVAEITGLAVVDDTLFVSCGSEPLLKFSIV